MIQMKLKKTSQQRQAIKQRYAIIGKEASAASKLVGLFRPPVQMASLRYHPRRKRRRFLVIPQSELELTEMEEAYCDGIVEQDNSWLDTMIANCGIESSSQQNRCRPLPSTQSILSNPNMNETTTIKKQPISDNKSTSSIHSSSSSLLLRKFYRSIGIKDPSSKDGSASNKSNNGEKATTRRQVIDEIDDPFLATLTIGHHNRYLKLTTDSQQQQHTSRRTHKQRKELKLLRQLVTKEQTAYRLSLDKFHELHKSRYMIGFGSSSSDSLDVNTTSSNRANDFCRWACAYSQSINQEWKNNMRVVAIDDDSNTSTSNNSKSHNNKNNINHAVPKRYGKVRQTLGLARRQSSLDVQDLTCSIVHDRERIPPPTIELAPPIDLLRNDKKALELASRYSATIVTTSESLETLLQLPGEYSAKWMLSCTKRTVGVLKQALSVTILDIPLAQTFSSPRICLESGLQEGLYQLFQQKQQQEQEHELCDNDTIAKGNEKKDIKSFIPPVTQAIYSLWTLPGKNTAGRKPTRVLIRTLVRLKDSTSKLPVRLRAHVEYFPSSSIIRNNNGDVDHDLVSRSDRKEIPSSYETSLWILDQVLFGHKVSCLQYRIDPTTCTILGWDPTSIAHAFAVSGSDRDPNSASKSTYSVRHGPLDHWESLIQLLQSIPSIDVSDCLLCLPGRVGETNVTINEIKKGASSREEITMAIDYDSDPEIHQQQQQQKIRVDPFSVSVHAPCEESYDRIRQKPQQAAGSQLSSQRSGPATATIDLEENVLDQAGAVILSEHALQDCRRDWEWNRPGQIPNTFPVLDKT
ncbi:hypothetical protein FRACYDRAFT_236975 [Fragilariopsis cylindrus CCMP1102]|uniref:Uncharacterized protein n=1 Tax=Fragilariopsis cylindrus CCMP1102 TaxID=635003 RepID=A0A1E7FKK1_9STRA|nr:hypothetical protein FRACYDRAFT_236975 [Fragilariopsis cylindrus CCMP1102]|eukprot:OEU18698.1 hypothetical protein FRACYDRAFT_236975 [Fragilariopsis cylindrus CCMP1102]